MRMVANSTTGQDQEIVRSNLRTCHLQEHDTIPRRRGRVACCPRRPKGDYQPCRTPDIVRSTLCIQQSRRTRTNLRGPA